MVQDQVMEKKSIDVRLKEAETYYTMGLVAEALEVYEVILTEGNALDSNTKDKIQALIEKLRQEIENQDTEGLGQELSQEVSVIKKGQSSGQDIQTILDAAFALRELGAYEEAVKEYLKLFRFEYPPEKTTSEICKCLLKAKEPASVFQELNKILDEQGLARQDKAKAKFRLGLEMEKINEWELSIQAYNSALRLDPEENRIKNRLYALKQKNAVEKSVPSEVSSDKILTEGERRKEYRSTPTIPEFVFVEFELGEEKGNIKSYKLHVINYSRHGLGLLVTEKQQELLSAIKAGDKIKDVTFYARWAIIKVDVHVRHISRLDKGLYKGRYVVGVESKDIIESAMDL